MQVLGIYHPNMDDADEYMSNLSRHNGYTFHIFNVYVCCALEANSIIAEVSRLKIKEDISRNFKIKYGDGLPNLPFPEVMRQKDGRWIIPYSIFCYLMDGIKSSLINFATDTHKDFVTLTISKTELGVVIPDLPNDLTLVSSIKNPSEKMYKYAVIRKEITQ